MFRPAERELPAPEWFRGVEAATRPGGRRYFVAITRAALDPSQRREMEAAGAEILGYLPVHGYRLRAHQEGERAVRSLPFVAWVGVLPAHLKVSGYLSRRAVRPDGPTSLRVVLAPGEPAGRVRRILSGLDSRATAAGFRGAWRLEAVVPAERLAGTLSRIASLPEVEAVEAAHPVRLFNQDAVWVHQSFVGPSPQQTPIFDRGIFGCGQLLSVADTGQDHDVCFFRDTVNGPPPVVSCSTPPCPPSTPSMDRRKDVLYYNWSGGPTGDDDTCPTTYGTGYGHGTHTSGSAAGDTSPYADCTGFTTPARNGGDGQAPGAKLVMLELGDDIEYLNDLGGTVWNIADVAYRSGARIHSFSLGGVCYDAFGQCVPGCELTYDSLARDADLAMWTYPDLLLVNAAGNGGEYCPAPNSVVTPALAKSLLAVGALGHGLEANTVPATSSPGPVHDGRLKPTVAAQGETVASAASDANPNSNNCGICSLSGSSMAAPTVAGLAALVREYYTAGYYAAGVRSPSQGFTPTGALVKATLIDGAVALGAGAPDPDFQSGYGRVKLDATLAFSGSPFRLRVVDDREGLGTGSVVTRAYDVSAGEPLRVTLAWSDYPADLNAAVARVNELRLEVIDPSGNVWFQTLDAASGLPVRTMNPADPHDTRNVEERLVFQSPAPGRWVVRVIGVDVPWGPQPFALVVRGALSDCPAPASPAAPSLSAPADQQVLVSWSPVPGAVAYNVYRSLGSCPAGPWVPVATAVTDHSYLDVGVSGGVAYSYRIGAASDPQAFCESAPSPCETIVPTGDCFLAPEFRGIVSASSSGSATCSITLNWNAATPLCGSLARYNVYRGTTAGFTPNEASRIAACVSGTSYTDSANLSDGAPVFYVVRAEDGTTGHGGPCGGGNEDGNDVVRSAAPAGPPAWGTWEDDAGDTAGPDFDRQATWTVLEGAGVGGSRAYSATSYGGLCGDLVSPVLTLAGPAEAPVLSFKTMYALDYDDGTVFEQQGTVGQVEISIGPDFTTWDRVELNGGYPTPTTAVLNACPTTQIPRRYFADQLPAFTGFSASLVNWAGNDVKLRFHLSGDYWWPGGTWRVDDVAVTKTLVPGPCATGEAGPPPVPDGASVPGQPMRASRNGSLVDLTWDSVACPAAAVNVYRGTIGDFTAFTAADCALSPSGFATLAMPDDSWFLVAATDGASTDGSWSRDAAGNELTYSGSTAACPAVNQHVIGNCP